MAPKKKHKAREKPKLEHIDGDFQLVGCDLSLTSPGFCLVQYYESTRSIKILRMGRVANKILPKGEDVRGNKLCRIGDAFADYLSSKKVKVVVKENSFSRFNMETQAIYATLGTCEYILWQLHQTDFQGLSPTSIKALVTGSGRADKDEVALAIDNYCEHGKFETNDVSDSVAVVIAWLIDNGYLNQKPLEKYIKKTEPNEE